MTAEPIPLRSSVPASSSCTCGHHGEEELVLDARQIPHAIRHATIFGALDSLAIGISLDLIANHNPLPLLAQLDERRPGAFETRYLEEGPDSWTLRLTRVA
jgi:uncharacterized protein (DUF2249 family)